MRSINDYFFIHLSRLCHLFSTISSSTKQLSPKHNLKKSSLNIWPFYYSLTQRSEADISSYIS